jgi:hypothetical protein
MEVFQAQQDEVAKFLISCLQDVKAQIVTVVREQKEGEDEPEISVMPGACSHLLTITTTEWMERNLGLQTLRKRLS